MFCCCLKVEGNGLVPFLRREAWFVVLIQNKVTRRGQRAKASTLSMIIKIAFAFFQGYHRRFLKISRPNREPYNKVYDINVTKLLKTVFCTKTLFSRIWKDYDKLAAGSLFADDLNMPAVHRYGLLRDGKAKPCAACFRVRAPYQPGKTVENKRGVLFGDTNAVVFNGDYRFGDIEVSVIVTCPSLSVYLILLSTML